jgi:hypothetical protein
MQNIQAAGQHGALSGRTGKPVVPEHCLASGTFSATNWTPGTGGGRGAGIAALHAGIVRQKFETHKPLISGLRRSSQNLLFMEH